MALARHGRMALTLQRVLSWACFPLMGSLAVAGMRLGLGYRIHDLKRLRRRVRGLLGKRRTPLLICANHLTMIDSALVGWTLASNWTYLHRFWLFAWNLPEKRNFGRNPALRLVCYLFKCLPIVRGGPPAQTQQTMEKVRHLLARGEAMFIFPEGTRSRSGRVNTEEFSYGVGRLCQQVEGVRVLCVYQRGCGQGRASFFPRRGETFYTELALIEPASTHTGLRGARDIATQIIQKLHEMEQTYFQHAAGGQ